MPHAPVMIVEDDADLREAICVTLDLHQIEYRAFGDAESALMAFDDQEFSLVVSDFKLPGMDGLTLLRSIRKKVPQLPVVIMTAFAEAKLAVEALQTGARDFLIKPFQPEHLVGVIARYQPTVDSVSNGTGHVKRVVPLPAGGLHHRHRAAHRRERRGQRRVRTPGACEKPACRKTVCGH